MSSCLSVITRVVFGSVLLTLAVATTARAQGPAAPAPAREPSKTPTAVPAVSSAPTEHPVGVPDADEEPEAPRRRWYGWQTLIADGSVFGLITVAFATEESSFLYAALGTYVIATPIVHVAHENPGRGFASLAMRVGVPVVLGVAASEASGCEGEYCAVALGGFGLLGALGVMALDAAVLAYDDADKARNVVAVIALDPGMTYVGARGAF